MIAEALRNNVDQPTFEMTPGFKPFTMLDPFAQLFQHCWGHARSLYRVYISTYGLHPSHDALQVPALLGVVASVCTPLPTPNIVGAIVLEVLRPFARSLGCSVMLFAICTSPIIHLFVPKDFL